MGSKKEGIKKKILVLVFLFCHLLLDWDVNESISFDDEVLK